MNSILKLVFNDTPFCTLKGTSMAAMTPLVSSAGPEFVALRLLPAGILVLITYLFKRDLKIYKCDFEMVFSVFTIVDATFFQLFLTYGIERLGAGLGSVLIDSQPLFGSYFSEGNVWEFN